MGDSASDSSNKPLRVLMTADAIGGVWRYSIDLVKELAQRGASVLLAVMGPCPSREQRQEALEISGMTLAESDFALEWMTNPWADVDAAGDWLLNRAANFAPDVIHLNGYAHAALDWQKPAIVVAHSCVFSWWQAVHGGAPGPEWDEYKERVTAGLTAADAIVAPSAFMAAALEREYGADSNSIRVIHNFSRTSREQGDAKEPFVLTAGRIWDQAKNIALLNSIAPEVAWEIRVAGGERGPESSTAAGKGARFLGALTHAKILKQMGRAAIFAHPALYEPFGLAVLEAASARCCLLLSDIPSLRELWEGAAIFANPRDPLEWACGLNALIRDPAMRQKLGDEAYSRASKYPPSRSVTQYWNLYRSLAATPRKEAAA
jgi:glycogen(starch) synthase